MTGSLVPFRQLVLKVHSRCDLACKHCYVYEHADQSWSSRPTVISDETISWTATRLAEHAKSHGLPSVHVILHGGEPLLAGIPRLRRVCEELRGSLAGISELDLRIHTNGVQLSERHLDLFSEFDVKVGISLDGDQAANDRHRVYANGRSSYQRVLRAVALLQRERYRHLFAGLLCTIDIANDPIAVYDALAALDPPRIDFLLPHATWDDPPARPDDLPAGYADWLLRIFDRWDTQGRPMPVRMFDSVISTLGGGPSLTESMGLGPADLVVIETDGTLEQADSLKTAYDGAPATGYDVFSDSLDTAARHPGVVARQQGLAGLSAECRACPVVRSCGGGLYAHRYRGDGSDFDNPSVFCEDLKSLVLQVSSRIGGPTEAELGRSGGVAVSLDGADTAPPLAGLAELAAGTGDGSAVRELAAAQRQVTRGWLDTVNAEIGDRGGELWSPAWQLLTELEQDPGGIDGLLGHPYTRSWAVACRDALSEPVPGAGSGELPQAGRLSALVAVAGLRAGLTRPMPVAVGGDGTVWLPALGQARLRPQGAPTAEVTAADSGFVIRRGDEEVRVTADAEPDERWLPVRHLTAPNDAGPLVDLALDDLDPYRDCYLDPVAPRLPDSQVAVWQRLFAQAWPRLRSAEPARAGGLAAGLSTVTPLAPGAGRLGGLAGSRRGMAAIGLVLPDDPTDLARRLLYEFQYATLDALLEQCELYDESDPRSFPVPGGDDRMPAGDLLARAYARSATAALAAQPGQHSGDTARAWETLLTSGVLTAEGERFASAALAGRAVGV
ncbi:radical SAM/SPASM protein FxsBH, inactivated beta-hydroxylase extension form [Streptomyces sp. CA-111067]|uniref:radical SAM/SPASM protein FxsBH, inactivated beta-hydroxylase extension form n=1 Tax=Streptomyces sp. CA-111067 TaxID=3240046 RepID=UPI003D968CB4